VIRLAALFGAGYCVGAMWGGVAAAHWLAADAALAVLALALLVAGPLYLDAYTPRSPHG
jgi:hypothetical protein